jgi:hypothetical protein
MAGMRQANKNPHESAIFALRRSNLVGAAG